MSKDSPKPGSESFESVAGVLVSPPRIDSTSTSLRNDSLHCLCLPCGLVRYKLFPISFTEFCYILLSLLLTVVAPLLVTCQASHSHAESSPQWVLEPLFPTKIHFVKIGRRTECRHALESSLGLLWLLGPTAVGDGAWANDNGWLNLGLDQIGCGLFRINLVQSWVLIQFFIWANLIDWVVQF